MADRRGTTSSERATFPAAGPEARGWRDLSARPARSRQEAEDAGRQNTPGGGYRQEAGTARRRIAPEGMNRQKVSGYCSGCRCIRSANHLQEGDHR